MKNPLIKLAGAVCLIAGLAWIGMAADVRRSGSAFVTGHRPCNVYLQVESNVLSAGITTNIQLRPGAGMALMFSQTTSNAVTGYTHYKFGLSVDGTNYNTFGAAGNIVPGQLDFLVLNQLAPGTNYITNIQASVLEGYRTMKLMSISNGAAKHLHVTNVLWSINRNEY